MSQIGVVGGMGSGKTYFAVEIILTALSTGRTVVTNIPLNIKDCPFLHQWEWDYLENEQKASTYSFYGMGGVLYVLDEAWRGIAAGGGGFSGKNKWLLSFFREHRKRIDKDGISDDIFVVSQDLDSINASIRNLFDTTIMCKKPSAMGIKGASIRVYHDGAIKGLQPVKKRIVKTEQIFLKPDVYTMYVSHDMGVNGGKTGGYKTEGTALNTTLFQSFKFKFLAVFFLLILFGGYKSFAYVLRPENMDKLTANKDKNKDVKSKDVKDNTVTSSDSDTHKNTVSVSAKHDNTDSKANNDNVTKLSTVWRIASVINNPKKKRYLIHAVDNRGHVMKIPSSDCIHDEADFWTCTYRNETITKYTGSYTNDSSNQGLFTPSLPTVTK